MFEKGFKIEEQEKSVKKESDSNEEEKNEDYNNDEEHHESYYNFRDLKQEFLYGKGKIRLTHRPFGKFKRKLIFLLLFFINILINVDHGAIPAATTILKRDLFLSNITLGILGSLVYLGLVLGAISASMLFQTYSSKWVVSISLIFSCFFLYTFTVSDNIFLLSISRIGCGFFQVKIFNIFKKILRYFVIFISLFGLINLVYMI